MKGSDAKLLVITGPDGAGKTTVATELIKIFQEREPDLHVVQLSPFNALKGVAKAFATSSPRESLERYLRDLTPLARYLLMTHAFVQALADIERESPDIVLVTGYWYKYAVSELHLGLSWDVMTSIGECLPKPSLTIQLDIDIATQCARKPIFTEYEAGFSPTPDSSAFRNFQTKVQATWNKQLPAYFAAKMWPWVRVDGKDFPAKIANNIIDITFGMGL